MTVSIPLLALHWRDPLFSCTLDRIGISTCFWISPGSPVCNLFCHDFAHKCWISAGQPELVFVLQQIQEMQSLRVLEILDIARMAEIVEVLEIALECGRGKDIGQRQVVEIVRIC